MPPANALIPLPGRIGPAAPRPSFQPAFSAPERWAILVLSWLAFFIAGYLAMKAVTGGSVAGCGVGSGAGCDVVLTSSWSKWLGIPVAVFGLAVYAALASLSPLLWWRNEMASRWITTAIVLLSVVAAGASAWDGYAASAVAEAGLASLAEGRRVDIKLAERPALYR